MKRGAAFLSILTACACLLSGCGKKVSGTSAVTTVPPAAAVPYDAPVGDRQGEYEMLATLYFPSSDGTQLAAVTEAVHFYTGQTEAQTILERLLSHEAGEDYQPVPGHGKVALAGADAVTLSCGVATVNLSVAALALSHTEMFTLFQAMTNTLCALDGVTGVNILVSGVSPGLDVGGTLPVGCLKQNTLDDPAMLHARLSAQRAGGASGDTPFRADAALYFPAQAGRGLLCETRTLLFSSSDAAQMTQTLLLALSEGAQDLENVPAMPDLNGELITPPIIGEAQGTGHKTVSLVFKESFNDTLVNLGITRSVMIASLVTTLTTYLPDVSVCRVTIGSEQVSALVPAGLYEGAGQMIGFSDGQMRRSDFIGFLLTNAVLYFADDKDTLTASVRALPAGWTTSPRALFDQLLGGPQYYDTTDGLKSVVPQGISDADLIGVKQVGDVLMLNFSSAFYSACESLNAVQARNFIYAIVNTMTERCFVKRVRLYILGEQTAVLGGAIALSGDFMRNVRPDR